MPAAVTRTRRIAALEERRDAIARELAALDDLVIERGSDLTDDERSGYEAHELELASIAKDLEKLVAREETIARSIELGGRLTGNGGRRDLHVHTGAGEVSGSNFREFFGNVLRYKLNGDPEAAAYIARSNEEQREILRATGTGDLPGIVIPNYESAVTVPVEAGRRFLNTLNRRDVTSEVVHVPTVDAEIAPGFQGTQNTAFTEVSYGTGDATYTTRTLGAFADVSVQAIDFSSLDPATILNELQRGYNRNVEQQAIRGTVDNATNLLGIVNTVGVGSVDGSAIADGAALWEAIGSAFADVDDDQMSDEVPHVLVSRRTWNALKHTMTAEHPILSFGFGAQVGNARGVQGIYDVGDYRFVVTNNVKDADGTDRAVVYLPDRVWFYEGNGGRLLTITDVISQASEGTVRVVARNYVNFPGVRPDPGAAAVITGLDLLPIGS
jgi:HK97 family phage major capsid protein